MNILLHANVPVNLYAATGIAAGTQIVVSLNSDTKVRLASTELGLLNDYITLSSYGQAQNKLGETQAWAMSFVNANINVTTTSGA